MEPTLCERLSHAEDWTDKAGIIDHYFISQPLAKQVAFGEDSYQKRVEEIKNRIDPAVILAQGLHKDKEFDRMVVDTIDSMNSVGKYEPINASDFTLHGMIWGRRTSVLVFGGISLALGVGLSTHFSYQGIDEALEAIQRNWLLAGASASANFLIMSLMRDSVTSKEQDRLEDQSEKLDLYLKGIGAFYADNIESYQLIAKRQKPAGL